MTYAPANSKTAYLNTAEVYPDDASELLVKLTSLHTDVANAINIREISLYQDGQSMLTGQQFSVAGSNQAKRTSYRKVFYFGPIVAGATLNIPHGITTLVQLTHAYGTCVTATDYRPIPYTSTVAIGQQISLRVIPPNIEIINGPGCPDIISGIVVIEYLDR